MVRIIRDYRPEDEPALRALHERQERPWAFPDLLEYVSGQNNQNSSVNKYGG